MTGIIALRAPSGLPYNQTPGASVPGAGWMKSADIGFAWTTDILAAANHPEYPIGPNGSLSNPRAVTSRILNSLQIFERIVERDGLKVNGEPTGIISETTQLQGNSYFPELRATNELPDVTGHIFASYDMMLTHLRLKIVAAVFRGGIIPGLENPEIVKIAERLLAKTTYRPFIDAENKLHRQIVVVPETGRLILVPGTVDNKHTEARDFVPILELLGGPRLPLAERLRQGKLVWDGMSFNWISLPAGRRNLAVGRGDGVLSAWTEYELSQFVNFQTVAPNSLGLSNRDYFQIAVHTGRQLGHQIYVTAPGTGVDPDQYAPFGISNPDVFVPVGSALALSTRLPQAVQNFENTMKLAAQGGGYVQNWGPVDSLDPKTGRANNEKRIFMNQALIVEALNYPILQYIVSQAPWYQTVVDQFEEFDKAHPAPKPSKEQPVQQKPDINLIGKIGGNGTFTQVRDYPSFMTVKRGRSIRFGYNLDGQNQYGGFWGNVYPPLDISGYRSARIKLGKDGKYPDKFKVEFKKGDQGGDVIGAGIYTRDPLVDNATIQIDITPAASLGEPVLQFTIVVESFAAGVNQEGLFTIEDITLSSQPVSRPEVRTGRQAEGRRQKAEGEGRKKGKNLNAVSIGGVETLAAFDQVPSVVSRPSSIGLPPSAFDLFSPRSEVRGKEGIRWTLALGLGAIGIAGGILIGRWGTKEAPVEQVQAPAAVERPRETGPVIPPPAVKKPKALEQPPAQERGPPAEQELAVPSAQPAEAVEQAPTPQEKFPEAAERPLTEAELVAAYDKGLQDFKETGSSKPVKDFIELYLKQPREKAPYGYEVWDSLWFEGYWPWFQFPGGLSDEALESLVDRGRLRRIEKPSEEAAAKPEPVPTQPAPPKDEKPSQPAEAPPTQVEAPDLADIQKLADEYKVSPEEIRTIQKAFSGLGASIDSNYVVHQLSGMPQDHFNINPATGRIIGNPVNYSAPSKIGAYLPFLLKAAQGHPMLQGAEISKEEALTKMRELLTMLLDLQKRGEGTDTQFGLFPWMEWQDAGLPKIGPYAGRRMVPSLDNGQATMALAAIAGYYWNAPEGTLERKVRDLALEILNNQHYEKMIEPTSGLLWAEWNLDQNRGTGKPGHLSLWTEWAIPMEYALWAGIIKYDDWLHFTNQTFEYKLPDGRVIDVPQGYIFSFHELWDLVYNGKLIMKSKLAPLYRNYLYLHAEHARENNMAGFVATEYGWDWKYTQGGIDVAAKKRGGQTLGGIHSQHQATIYGTALAALIDPRAMEWVAYHLKQPGVVQTYGPVTSFTRRGGASTVYTADSTFVTATALAGGVHDEIAAYFKHRYGLTEADLIRAFDGHAEMILKRLGRTQFRSVAQAEIPLPPKPGDYSVEEVDIGALPEKTINLSARLEAGHWHGTNVSVPPQVAAWRVNPDQKWVMKEGVIAAQYQTTGQVPYAWLGTMADPVSIRGAKYLSLWVPVALKNERWDLELKAGDLELAPRVRVNTDAPGVELSSDKKWKKLILEIRPNELANTKPLNYLAVSTTKNSGYIYLRDVQIHQTDPRKKTVAPQAPKGEQGAAPQRSRRSGAARPSTEKVYAVSGWRRQLASDMSMQQVQQMSRYRGMDSIYQDEVNLAAEWLASRAVSRLREEKRVQEQLAARAEVRAVDAPVIWLPESVEPNDVRRYLTLQTGQNALRSDVISSRRDFLKTSFALGAGAVLAPTVPTPISAQEQVRAPNATLQAKATLLGMMSLIEERTGLVVDKARIDARGNVVQLRGNADFMKTSPTNIGLGIVSVIIARDQRWMSREEAQASLTKMVSTLEKMERHQGFWYNWYNLASLDRNGAPQVTLNRFLSSVDNANLTASLWVLREAVDGTALAGRVQELLDAQDWNFFYTRQVWLMNHGYDAAKGSYSPYDYGTFNTEARLLSFISVLQGVDQRAWDGMSRDVLPDKSGKILVVTSWGGSLFETLFADIFMNAPDPIAQNNRDTVTIHRNKAQELGYKIWGWSPALDPNGIYRESGVPEIGARGGGQGYPVGAVSPYSSLLAARYVDPKMIAENLNNMRALNPQAYSQNFGYRDVIDPKTGRVGNDILSLDKGMEVAGFDMLFQSFRKQPGTAEKYFWMYLERKGLTARGKELLNAENEKFF